MTIDWNTAQLVAVTIATYVSGMATVALAVLTWRYVRLTQSMVQEMRESREPEVFADMVIPDGMEAELVFGNQGLSAARQVRVSAKDSLPWERQHRPLGDLPIVRDGIPYLPPGRTMRYRIGFIDWKQIDQGGSLALVLTYTTESGKPRHRTVEFRAAAFKHLLLSSFREPATEIADALKEMNRYAFEEQLTRTLTAAVAWCPWCGEQVRYSARKCPHCLEAIERPQDNQRKRESTGPPW